MCGVCHINHLSRNNHLHTLQIDTDMKTKTEVISARIVAAIDATPDLADKSKKQYKRNLDNLVQISGLHDCWSAILAHKSTIEKMADRYPAKFASQHAMVSVVLAVFRYTPGLKDAYPKVHLAWSACLLDVKKPLDERVMTAQPTERQALGWVPLSQIIEKRHTLPVGSPERLLLGMYVDIAPRRNDYANLKLYHSPPLSGTKGNYLVLGKEKVTLTLTEYKTSKIYHAVSEVLPDTLVADIKASLLLRPRDVLFVSTKSGRPYKSEAVFGNWANATLKEVFGKPLTLTMIRHSFITSLKFDEMTPGERTHLATLMGHSRDTQGSYKFIFRRGGFQPAECECDCTEKSTKD